MTKINDFNLMTHDNQIYQILKIFFKYCDKIGNDKLYLYNRNHPIKYSIKYNLKIIKNIYAKILLTHIYVKENKYNKAIYYWQKYKRCDDTYDLYKKPYKHFYYDLYFECHRCQQFFNYKKEIILFILIKK